MKTIQLIKQNWLAAALLEAYWAGITFTEAAQISSLKVETVSALYDQFKKDGF